jgi:hypothetical protein
MEASEISAAMNLRTTTDPCNFNQRFSLHGRMYFVPFLSLISPSGALEILLLCSLKNLS